MERKPVFLLGIGIQKAGTTWLNEHLVNHPDTAFQRNFTKELNLHRHQYRQKVSPMEHPVVWLKSMKCRFDLMRHRFQGGAGDFFMPLLNRPRHLVLSKFASTGALNYLFLRWSRPTKEHPNGLVVGDITPNIIHHSKISLTPFLALLRADFQVRPFLIWRDPLSRLDSALKHARRHNDQAGIRSLEEFCRSGAMEAWARQSNYAGAIETLDEVFPDAHEMLYEELFGPSGQTHLEAFHQFAGIRKFPGQLHQAVHRAGSNEVGLTDVQKEAARGFLDVQYDAMRARFGEKRLAPIWNL